VGHTGDDAGDDDALVSRAAALGWDPARPVRVVVGPAPDPRSAAEHLSELRRRGVRADRPVLAAVQGARLVVVQAEPGDDRDPSDDTVPDAFGPGPVVVGPRATGLTGAHASAREALAGLRAAPGRPDCPRPVVADDLLPERALVGDPAAHRRLIDSVVAPLDAAGGELLHTLAVYVEGGGALEACARVLYVHPNTVRYRLRRIGEITGFSPTHPRDSFVLRTAVVVSRLQRWSKSLKYDG
jgi:sugar diacid utilization regulator